MAWRLRLRSNSEVAVVTEAIFEQFLPQARRIAGVRAARAAYRHRLPTETRQDLEQEALLELWCKRGAYDQGRGSWCTFAERLVANRLASLVRAMRAQRSGTFRERPLEESDQLAAPDLNGSIGADVARILLRVNQLDRTIAICLSDHSVTETGRRLRVSRATVYRAISRLRATFIRAGFARESGL